MKIGIITLWDSSDNYGQQMQCYALQRYLRDLGHHPFLIRYKEDEIKAGFKIQKILTYLIKLPTYIRFVLNQRTEKKYRAIEQAQDRKFAEFRSQNLSMSENEYSQTSLMENPPEADAYICGSDQIWGRENVFYLSFAPDIKPKIAYAPSLGGRNPFVGEDKNEVIQLLKRLDFIGVREESGAELIRQQGIDATQVVDPTLLLTSEQYDELLDKLQEEKSEGYAFVYLLGNTMDCKVKDIFSFITKKGLEYKYVASQSRVDEFLKTVATIPEWIKSIKNSRLVITNSFHCMVFAMTYRKPFIYLPLSAEFARMNGRIYDILKPCKLEGQIYKGDFESISLNPDYSAFEEYINFNRNKSAEVFKKYLN